jgi:small subunit ribosomal protein S6
VNDYEILLMLDPELEETRGDEIIARLRERVEGDGGTWDGHEPWGRRRLAYEIGHKGEAVYHLLLFSAAPDTLHEVSRVLKITDGVMRHLAVRRVKDGQRTAPPQPPAPTPSAAATALATAPPARPAPAAAAEPSPAAPSETADDAVEGEE